MSSPVLDAATAEKIAKETAGLFGDVVCYPFAQRPAVMLFPGRSTPVDKRNFQLVQTSGDKYMWLELQGRNWICCMGAYSRLERAGGEPFRASDPDPVRAVQLVLDKINEYAGFIQKMVDHANAVRAKETDNAR